MRTVVNFNTKWAFSKEAVEVPQTMPERWYWVNLPHTWNAIDGQDGGNDLYRGTAYYAKELEKIDLPEADQYYLENESPQPVLDKKSLHDEKGDPCYCSDKIVWHKEELELTGNAFDYGTAGYYRRLYDHMVNGGELFIKPEHIIPEIQIFEEIERQNPLEVKFDI